MMRALYSSVAGLRTHQTKMDVIGNNISNVNTVGFKSSRVTFSTMIYQTLKGPSAANAEANTGGVNSKQIGLGTTFASTAISLTTGGAPESTGGAFDLKISDTNSTSFYIVNNGSENVFTRAGAFYVDGAGNLCMESTGYTVMGWQVDANGNIQKDTVTPLKIMTAANQTSEPEWTTKALCQGILDDNNANVNSDNGYKMNLNFFDNLGYPYTGRFAVQKAQGEGFYTINLTDVINQDGKSIFNDETRDLNLGDFFGTTDAQGSQVDITNDYMMASGKNGALKKLAVGGNDFVLGTPETYKGPNSGGEDGEAISETNPFVMTFDAKDVNEYFGSELPEGAIVQLVYTGADADSYTVRIVGRSGEDLSAKYAAAVEGGSAPPWFSTEKEGGTITATKTAAGILEEMGVSNGDVLTKSQIRRLNSELRLGETTGEDGGDVTAALDVNQSYTVRVSDGAFELRQGAVPEGTSAEDAATMLEGFEAVLGEYNLVLNLTDIDFLKKAYVEVSGSALNTAGIFTTKMPGDVQLRYQLNGTGSFTIVTPRTDGFTLKFSTVDGSLEYIGMEGSTSQMLNLGEFDATGNKFSNISIDFSALKNLANGKSCTAALASGDTDAKGAGKKVGAMTGLTVDQSGKIYGTYDNGNRALIGQIAVARFANASGLESIGNNCYKTTLNSGEFDGIGLEIDADGSKISTGELEMSNVDLATEFTTMITTQRGYQANSRVITTSDGILEELVNLKR